MAIFFGGRLWTSPATMAVVDDSAMANLNPNVGNRLAVIGRSAGGAPLRPLRFGTPTEAKAVLVEGELLDAVLAAFDPSGETGGPAEVVAIRVNPAVQAGLSLLNSGGTAAVTLVSTDYGALTNQVKVKVESGSIAGKRLTVQRGNDYFTRDDVARAAFQIRYTGAAASAVLSITNTSVVLQAPSGTPVATIALTDAPTIEKLVDRLNAVPGFAAAVLDGNGPAPALNGLDAVTAIDVKTADYVVRADLQAVVDWLNGAGEGFVTATRPAAASAPPANVGFTYLTGGSDGVVTNAEWGLAFAALQTVDVQQVVPVSGDASIRAMTDAHCVFMSNIARKRRRCVVGTPLGTTDAAALAAAKAMNSDRAVLVHVGHNDFDSVGNLVLRGPYITAARVAGMACGVNPGTPLTNKAIRCQGLERAVRNPTDTDQLIDGGVCCIEDTPTGFRIVKSCTTWLNNRNYNRVEMSTGVAVDYVLTAVERALDPLRGSKGGPLVLGRAVSITESTLRELARPEPGGIGVLVGDENSPPYRNIIAKMEGDVVRVDFECSPCIPVNFIPITAHAVPYSGSATLAA